MTDHLPAGTGKSRISIGIKLAAAFLFIGLILSLAGAGFLYALGVSAIADHVNNLSKVVTARLQHSLVQPIFQYDQRSIEAVVRAEFSDLNVQSVLIIEEDGYVLFGLHRNSAGEEVEISELDKTDEGYLVETPIHDRSGALLAHLSILINPVQARRQLIGRVLVLWALFASLGLIAAAAAYYFMQKLLASPLGDIHEKMQEYSASPGLAVQIENPGGFAELNDIAQSFNEVVRSVIQHESDLTASERNLDITLNAIGDAVIATDDNGAITRMNPVAEALTGWTFNEALGRDLKEVFHILDADTHEPVPDPVEKVLKSGTIVGLGRHTILVAREGVERQIAESGAPIIDDNNKVIGVVLVFRDVTEQHRLQHQLQQAQKMESLGKLVGGIAHDFNNMLAAIQGSAELLALSQDGQDKELIDTILQAAGRASDLTSELLIFSRRAPVELAAVDVHDIISAAVTILEHSIDRAITIEVKPLAEQSIIMGASNRIEQALINLGVNARDAIGADKGTISISTEMVQLTARDAVVDVFELEPGEYIKLTVSDTGSGMSEETLAHVFEPFFTTKEVGKGTGLGMASVYGTVRDHNGGVVIESQLGTGTSCILYFPLHSKQEYETAKIKVVQPVEGSGRILIADDEAAVLNVARILVEKLGYEVVLATNGKEALERFNDSGPFDLVMLDMNMPELSGRDVVTAIRKDKPEQKIIVLTGYSSRETLDSLQDLHIFQLVMKPFRIGELSQVIATALGDGTGVNAD